MPLPMMAFPRLKTDMPKEALPWCWGRNGEGEDRPEEQTGRLQESEELLRNPSHTSSCLGCVRAGSSDTRGRTPGTAFTK